MVGDTSDDGNGQQRARGPSPTIAPARAIAGRGTSKSDIPVQTRHGRLHKRKRNRSKATLDRSIRGCQEEEKKKKKRKIPAELEIEDIRSQKERERDGEGRGSQFGGALERLFLSCFLLSTSPNVVLVSPAVGEIGNSLGEKSGL